MIDANTFILFGIITYIILGVIYILLGACQAKKTYESHYGLADVLTGLILLGVSIGMYVI